MKKKIIINLIGFFEFWEKSFVFRHFCPNTIRRSGALDDTVFYGRHEF